MRGLGRHVVVQVLLQCGVTGATGGEGVMRDTKQIKFWVMDC